VQVAPAALKRPKIWNVTCHIAAAAIQRLERASVLGHSRSDVSCSAVAQLLPTLLALLNDHQAVLSPAGYAPGPGRQAAIKTSIALRIKFPLYADAKFEASAIQPVVAVRHIVE
jgi:hypothetical protein